MRAWRKSKDLDQTEAAALVDVWQGTWAAWETGRKRPSIEMLDRIEKLTRGSRHRLRVSDWVESPEEREERRRLRAG